MPYDITIKATFSAAHQIRFNDRSNPSHKVKTKLPGDAAKIFYLATGNHEMYRRRRMPDPLDVQQMKVRRGAFETL